MSRPENGLKDTALTQSANFFFHDTLRVTAFAISTPESYDEHPVRSSMGVTPGDFPKTSGSNKHGVVIKKDRP